MSMGSRILEARTRKGLTQEALAEKIGVTKGAVANYENSVSFPKIDILFKLFEVLEVDANYLYQDYVNFTDNSKLSDEEIDLIIDYRNITQNGKRMVRTVLNEELRRKDDEGCPPSKPVSMIVYTFPAAAGLPLYADDDSYERMNFPADKVPKGTDFGIRISGDSMEPTINDGDIVFVRKTSELYNNEIGIFMLDAEAVCKRYQKNGRGIVLLPDNPNYPSITVKNYQRFAVVGKVLNYK